MQRFSIPLVLILSAGAFAQTDPIPDETVEVFRCDFEEGTDANYDLWPDDWTRRRGRGYPTYVKVEISASDSATKQSKRCLRMDLDGGAVSVYSPRIPVSPLFSYTLAGFVKTAEEIHDSASMEVIFYDENDKPVGSHASAPFRTRKGDKEGDTKGWHEVLIGPVTPANPQVRWAAIALHLIPGEKAGLTGSVMFDEISFGQLPRMSLATNKEHNIYALGEPVEITCRLSGFTGREPRLRFELRDVTGRVLESHEGDLDANATSKTAPAAARARPQTGDDRQGAFLGSLSWRPRVHENGFYQVQVSVLGHRGLTRTVNLVVADQPPERTRGEFGWSLPDGDKTLPLRTLASLLRHVGINWIKFPMWYDDDRRASQLAWFAERASIDHVEMVGLLDQPPDSIRDLFGEGSTTPIASVFVEKEIWNPAIDSLMTRLSLKIRWWQLGADQDTSFVNYPDLENKLNEIRKGFNRFGQDGINLGTTWRAIDEVPFAESPPLAFLSYTADPPLTDDELREYLAGEPNGSMQRWVVLEPLNRDTYSLETRARDLVKRMLAAKMGKAQGIFVPRPFDRKHGLMEPDGTPGPLLLPWRIAAEMLAGTRFLTALRLPNGSSNYVFQRDDEAVMVVWNSRPTTETVFLGEEVRQVDLWGRTTLPNVVKDRDNFVRQEVQVGTLPTFVTGVNAAIAKMRMSVQFETTELESVFGQRQRVKYHYDNSFRQGVGGSVTLLTPPGWIVEQPTQQFKLSSGKRQTENMDVSLGANASSGPQKIRLDFNLSADRSYRFSVYREIQVGLGDIELELETHLDEYGNLVVDQHLTNKTDRFVSFNCLLFVPNRRRERRQIFELGRGRQTTRFVIADGEELIGLTLGLRAEEIGGARVLNHRIVAEE